MSYCPFCCARLGTRQDCTTECEMAVNGECVIKKGFVALAQTHIKSSGSEI